MVPVLTPQKQTVGTRKSVGECVTRLSTAREGQFQNKVFGVTQQVSQGFKGPRHECKEIPTDTSLKQSTPMDSFIAFPLLRYDIIETSHSPICM